MSELLYEDSLYELWMVNDYKVRLALPNWSTLWVYAEVWSSHSASWNLFWQLDPNHSNIVKAHREKTDMDVARDLDRGILMRILHEVL